jgi:hypothetical protein
MKEYPMTMEEFEKEFGTEKACRDYIISIRWPNGFQCPRCGHNKAWLLGTHQGTVSGKHLDYYLDEYTFRFNRRTSHYRGKLFYRLIQNAVAVEPFSYEGIVNRENSKKV